MKSTPALRLNNLFPIVYNSLTPLRVTLDIPCWEIIPTVKKSNLILVLSLLLNLILLGFGARHVAFKIKQPPQYEQIAPSSNTITFCGDSRIQQADFATGLQRNDIANIGEGGTTTADWLRRPVKGRTVVIQLGINDIRQGVSVDSIWIRYRRILCRLKGRVIVTSTIPVHEDIWQDSIPERVMNERVAELNQRLCVTCHALGVPFVDLSKLNNGIALDVRYTIDGVHLNSAGNEVIFNELNRVL